MLQHERPARARTTGGRRGGSAGMMEGVMVERRRVMGGGVAAGLAALFAPADGEAAAQRDDDGALVARAVENLRATVQSEFQTQRSSPWRGVTLVREQQRTWLRSTQKYPDFLEVGINVWESLHDWHIHFQQPVNMARMTDGRYAIVFMFTTVILRPELMPDYVGLPYDADRPRR
jgi:hypothetical protein